MVDALALGASGATHGGSSPLPPTKNRQSHFCEWRFFVGYGLEPWERGRGNGSFPVVEESKPQGVEESRLVRDDGF